MKTARLYKVKRCSSHEQVISELQYGVSLAVRNHRTRVNIPRRNSSIDRPVLDLPIPEGWKAELTYDWLYTEIIVLATGSRFRLRANVDRL